MICDVMPTISEDANSQGERDSQISGEGANVEEMLLSMLDERDRLMEGLREVQEHLIVTQGKLEECEKDKLSLQKQMADTMPQEVAALTKEVNQLRQRLEQRDEEISDLKAERNNTRLLLEHLECLVSRHERSLRMTVVKRQVVNPAGVSSEVEVLKALKSLFEHHKALDEKVRERLKVAVDKATQLEEEVAKVTAELNQYKTLVATKVSNEPLNLSSMNGHDSGKNVPIISIDMQTSDYVNMPTNNAVNIGNSVSLSNSSSCEQLPYYKHSNIVHGHSHDDLIKLEKAAAAVTQQQITALQDLIDQQNSELLSVRKEIIEKTTKIRELEDSLTNTQKNLQKTLEQLDTTQQQLNESEAQRGDQEERIATLEKRYQCGQKEISKALEESDKAKSDLAMKETEFKQMEERINQLKNRLEQTESQLVRCKSSCNVGLESELTSAAATVAQKRRAGNQATMTEDEDSIDNQMNRSAVKKKENIAAANDLMLSIAEDKIDQLESRIAEAEGELCRAAQRDKLNEEHNNRLTATVSKLLSESNDRLQCHLEEKMRNLKEKNDLNSELDRIRRLLDSTKAERDTLVSQTQWLKDQISEYSETTMNMRQQIESLRTALLITRENAAAEKMYIAGGSLPRSIGNMSDNSKRIYVNNNQPPYESMMAVYNNENWNDNTLQKKNISNEEMNQFPMEFENNIDFHDSKSNLQYDKASQAVNREEEMDSPTGASDAKALALMIQEQLDAINNEIRLIQEEKETTEQRADELESRVGSSTNMGIVGSWSPPPPLSGRSTPNGPPMNWQHHTINSRPAVRNNYVHPTESTLKPSWLIGQHSMSTPLLPSSKDRGEIDNHDGNLNNQIKYNSMNRQSDYITVSEMSKQLDNLLEEDTSSDKIRNLLNQSPIDDIGQVHVEPRHIRCESSPPITPRLNRAALVGPNSLNTSAQNQIVMERNHHYTHHPIVMSPQSSPSSGSQDSLHNPTLCASIPRVDFNNSVDRKKSRLTSTLSRIFKKDRGGNKDASLSGGRLEIGSPVPSAVTPMTNFQQNYRLPMEFNVRPSSASLPYQFSHHQYYTNQNSIHGTLQPRMGVGTNNMNINNDMKDLLLGNNTLPLGKQTEDKRRKKKEELLEEAMHAKTPFTFWNGPTIVAWLELWVKMPAWYVAACRANVKSGAVMAALSDQEIQREIGISNPLHRLKLRLAIQEMVAVTSGPSGTKVAITPLVYGEMDHEWIGQEWLPSLDLGQYRSAFMENLVDARMLEHLTKRDLRNQLKMLDSFHRSSLQYGICLLRRINYNRMELDRRRNICQGEDVDLLVWTHDRVVKWLNSIGLKDYTSNLKDSGLHGAILALDNELDSNAIALMLQIPSQYVQLRARLDKELATLLQPYRSIALLTSNDHIDSFNYNQSKQPEYLSDEEFDTDREQFNSSPS